MNSPLALRDFIPHQLGVLNNQMSHLLTQACSDHFSLSKLSWQVLLVLGEQPSPTSAKEIIALTGLEKMQVSRAISQLKKRGWLDQYIPDEDRRFIKIQLNESGRETYGQIASLLKDQESRCLAALEPAEREVLKGLLSKLSD